ncbi:MAG: DUF3135 domain-containing protein [Glaciimonas sp.]|nr:DUF3135 domain-containing protein [Glaciimonas sp.]
MHLAIQLPDFDMLASLYRDDPESFEAFRRHVLREVVDAAPPPLRPTLELLLSHIEITRAEAATPMEAAIIAFRMMQNSVGQLHNIWEQTQQAVAVLQTAMIIAQVRK